MADKAETDKPIEPQAGSQSSRTKRRLRVASETVREKAVKAETESNKPTRRHKTRRILGLPFRGLAWLGHRPPLRQIGHGLRWFFALRVMRFLGKILGIKYLIDSFAELKMVAWPSVKQSRQLTFAVIIFSVVFGGVIAGMDFGLNKLFKEVLLK